MRTKKEIQKKLSEPKISAKERKLLVWFLGTCAECDGYGFGFRGGCKNCGTKVKVSSLIDDLPLL